MIPGHKVVIIGCGMVGSTIAYTLMLKSIFTEMVLIDTDIARSQGEAMDISHGMPFIRPMNIHAGTYDEVEDAELIIITAGGNQKPRETRLDLVDRNIATMEQIIPRIMSQGFNGLLLIVSNPVDILTYVAWSLSGLPSESVIGTGTVLDSARLRYLIGRRIGVDSRSVHAFIIGEHGDSEFGAFSQANVSGIPLHLFCTIRGIDEAIEQEVKNAAYEIISRKKATYYGIAAATARICEAIVRDEQSILPVSSVLHGEYNIDDIALSLPRIVGSKGIEGLAPIKLNINEHDSLIESAEFLSKTLRSRGY